MVWRSSPIVKKNKIYPMFMTKLEKEAFCFFKENGEDLYINHCTKAKNLKAGVQYLVRQNVVYIIGEGPEKKIIWNPLLPRKGRRNDIVYRARALKKKRGTTQLVKKKVEQERKYNTLMLSQLGPELTIIPPGPEDLFPKVELTGTHMEELVQRPGGNGIGYVKNGKLVGFQYDGEVSVDIPLHDQAKKILISDKQIFFI
jgi:hypothetical protein